MGYVNNEHCGLKQQERVQDLQRAEKQQYDCMPIASMMQCTFNSGHTVRDHIGTSLIMYTLSLYKLMLYVYFYMFVISSLVV